MKKRFFLAYESGYDYFHHKVMSSQEIYDRLTSDEDLSESTNKTVLNAMQTLEIGDIFNFGYGSIIRLKDEN